MREETGHRRLDEARVSVAGMDPEHLARITARMQAFVQEGTIAGATMLVARHEVVAYLEAVGYQDLESKKPMTTDTIFQIRSMTKPVTAVGIMILLEEGRLALADPVEKHLPEFVGISVEKRRGTEEPVLEPPSRLMTIQDLMIHTAGLRHGSDDYGVQSSWSVPLQEEVKVYARGPLLYDPGTMSLYSNVGFHVLGRIIEAVANQRYEEFIRTRIFDPLGMKDSFFFPPLDKVDRIAKAYQLEKGQLVEAAYYETYRYGLHHQQNPCPAWGMYSTASDLFAFLQMMLNGGTHKGRSVLSRDSVQLMTQVHTGELEDPSRPAEARLANRGLGWRVAADPRETLQLTSIGTYFHASLSGSFEWVDPKKDLVGIYLVQRFDWPPVPSEERAAFMAMAAAAISD